MTEGILLYFFGALALAALYAAPSHLKWIAAVAQLAVVVVTPACGRRAQAGTEDPVKPRSEKDLSNS